MKSKLTASLLVTFLIAPFIVAMHVQAQNGGRPAIPTQVFMTQYEVIRSVALAPAIPEAASTQTPGIFYKNRIELTFQPGWAVILSSTPDGNGALCSDDLVKVQSSNGFVFKHDYRSADRNYIEPIRPLAVTRLFVTGDNTIDIELADLFPDYKSSSAYYLVIVSSSSASLPMPAPLFKPVLPTLTSTFTPPPPTATTTTLPTSTSTPMPMATINLAPLVVEHTPAPSLELPSFSLPFPLRYLLLGFTVLTVLAIIAWLMKQQPRLTGVLEIAKNGEPWEIVDLSTYGRTVTIGSKGRIKLEDDDEENSTIPPIAVRLIAERGADGQVQVVWQNSREDSDLEATAYHIRHGHVEVIGPHRLVYENLSEVELTEDYIDGGFWNELSK